MGASPQPSQVFTEMGSGAIMACDALMYALFPRGHSESPDFHVISFHVFDTECTYIYICQHIYIYTQQYDDTYWMGLSFC